MTARAALTWRAARSCLIVATSLLLLLTALQPPPADAVEGSTRGGLDGDDLQPAEVEASESLSRTAIVGDLGRGDEPRTYLIRFRDPAVPSYRGGVAGLEATSPRGSERLEADSQPVREYRDHLEETQVAFAGRMDRSAGRDVEVPFTYQFAVNGMAAVLTPEEARQVAQDPEVLSIALDQERELQTDSGPGWIGADEVWGEGGAPTGVEPCEGACGEGIIIGTIDTGISPANPSFAEVGDDGYVHTNPLGDGVFLGACDPGNTEQFDADFHCNNKLIGAYGFLSPTDTNAVDYDGHGSHTASTSGGNVVNDVVVETESGFTTPPFDIAGVAPHANIIAYLGCCSLSGLTASIDQAIVDGVDVINYSIGSDAPSKLWEEFDTVGFLNARAANIIVVTSNGNSGPGDATTGSPADAPWIISVGASTHNRHNGNALTDLASGEGSLPDIEGKSTTGSLGATPIVYAGAFGDPLCLEDSGNEAAFDGTIVICDRGVNGRVLKSQNVANQRAVGFVLINEEPHGASLLGDEYAVPGVYISFDDGQELLAWLDNGADDHTAAIAGTTFEVDGARGDIMASFSSRGPNQAIDVIVPDVTAPGVDILAALGAGGVDPNDVDPDPVDYDAVQHGFISGTSMSSPHTAGAAALIRQAREDWTPAQVQSALMTTADSSVRNHDGTHATPYQQGAGRIDVPAAIAAGLLFDETEANYLAANPADGGDPKTLNIPSFADFQCLNVCSWQRTAEVPASAPAGVTWTPSVVSDPEIDATVDLSVATVSPGEAMTITVEADVTDAARGETYFGRITLTPDDGAVPPVTMALAVVPSSGILPSAVDITTRRDAGSQLVEGLRAIEITDFTASVSGLAEADLTEMTLSPDRTSGDPYDNIGDGTVEVVWVDVPANSRRLVAEILESQPPDLDLFVGFDADGDGEVDAEEEVDVSAGGTALETVDVPEPQAGAWWVLVQFWSNTRAEPAGDLTLSTAVVPHADLGNASIEGPETQPVGEPFDIRVFWDLDDAEAGDRFYGTIDLGSSAATPGDIGSIPMTLSRVAGDVTKVADIDEADPGETVTYTLEVAPNVTPEDLAYTITDTIPDGMTYVPASLTGDDATVDDGVITWTPTMPTAVGVAGAYTIQTNGTDPACAIPFGDGSYVDFRDFGIFPNPGIEGDTTTFTTGVTGAPFDFLGQAHTGITFTDDGFLIHDRANYGGSPWVPEELPDPDLPNNLLALLWDDYEIVFDESADDAGASLAEVNFGLPPPADDFDGPEDALVIDYRHLPPFGAADFSEAVTMQVWAFRSAEDTRYEFYVAFDELNSLTRDVTAGWENAAGTEGGALYNAEPAAGLNTDTVICYDYEGPTFDPAVITYQATVDDGVADTNLTNIVEHITDNPGDATATTSATVAVGPGSGGGGGGGGGGGTPGGVPQVSVTADDDSFTFTRTGGATDEMIAAYGVGGTAEPGEDYTELSGLVTFDAGSATATVDVDVLAGATEGATIEVTVVDGDVYDVGSPSSATITIGESQTPPAGEDEVTVLAGATRIQTAIAISQNAFPEDGSAEAVILARADVPFDALAATPLAPDKNGPLLLTDVADLHADTAAEIGRVLADGGTVYVLGGTAALSEGVETALTAAGFNVVRISGPTRYETALAVAEEVGEPEAILIASGEQFPDALSAGAAAADAGGLVLLTPEHAPHDAVLAYVGARPDTPVYAIGGPAAGVFTDATPIVGSGREATSVMVAEEFFDAPTMVGLARGDEFADALTGGAHAALQGGPVVLTPSTLLHPEVETYLCGHSDTLTAGFVYGGDAAIQAGVVADFTARLAGEGCTTL